MIVGRANSLLKPTYYLVIFSSFDLLALTVQAVGGAEAAKAQVKGTSTVAATNLVVSSIAFLLLSIRKLESLSKPAATWCSLRQQSCYGIAHVAVVVNLEFQRRIPKLESSRFMLRQSLSPMRQSLFVLFIELSS